VRSNYRDDSDLDLAFEIDKAANDSNAFATWIFEKQRWEKDLAKIINLKLHLELLDNDTPTVQAGVKSGSVVLYARKTTKGSKRFTPT
jgi:hypothetical protein